MMMSEFIERTGFEPTAEEYAEIEAEYIGCDIDKDQFCKQWKKNGGIQRLSRQRVRRIKELEDKVAMQNKQHDEMDISYRKSFNNMHDAYEEEVAELKEKIAVYEELTARRYDETMDIKEELKEANYKLETIRAAFAILGFSNEKFDTIKLALDNLKSSKEV